MGNEWATIDTISPEKITHIKGTIEKVGGKLVFWLSQPRPEGISIDEWEVIQQEKWDRIFKKGE